MENFTHPKIEKGAAAKLITSVQRWVKKSEKRSGP